jgi:hypothetical protein
MTQAHVRDDRAVAEAALAGNRASRRRFLGEWRDLRTSLIIGICCLLVYNVNGRAISAGDAIPARYLPFAILGHGTVLLDPIASVTSQGRKLPDDPKNLEGAFWMVPTSDGHRVSLYSIVLPVLISPLYVPAVVHVSQAGWTDARVDHVGRVMEKLTASFIAAFSAALLFLLLRRRVDARIAVLLTVAYAFGTSTWVISSQALWQHGMAQLLIVGVMLFITAPSTAARTIAAGLLCGLIVGNRPPDAVLAAALGAYGLFWAGRRAPLFAVAATVPVALVLCYNVTVVGALGGGYGLLGDLSFMRSDLWWVRRGVAGLLVSPTRGLLIFSPFFLFLALAWRYLPGSRAERGLTLAMSVGIIAQILAYAMTDWRAGLSWGPRFLTDLTPMLIWMLVPVVVALGGHARAGFVATVVVAIAIEAIGAFTYTSVTDLRIFAAPVGKRELLPAWEWRNAPFIAGLSQGVAPPELLHEMRGTVDAFAVDGRYTDVVVAGDEVVATGWALAGRSTPLQVGLSIDGGPPIAVRTFVDRPDVRRVFPGAAASGWRIPIDTAALSSGEHRVSLHLWASEKGETYFLGTRTLTVQAPERDLNASFRTAVARIREHQQQSGYWLTAFTTATRFERPQREMNTYLTSLLVDLLDPVEDARLGESLQRARQHLTAQVEATGLVRYHGLPDGPVIGTLGCKITPDTDDTALVWRIAPPADRGPLSAALSTIETYRRPDGLYRTWLAPREAYQCLDPGGDPNPADLTIQMHLLQLLAIEQPPAALALCQALRRQIDQTDAWVYYRLAPVVPLLRTTDLERAGCSLILPAPRMHTTVPGQEIWVSVAQLLSRLSKRDGPQPDQDAIEAVLHEIANNQFAIMRQNPPLLYHNDLTATVPRYYWSEDVGYALWLRLAVEGGIGQPRSRE